MYTTLDGRRTTIAAFLAQHLNGSPVVYIGSDSKNGGRTKFSTVLVAYTPGRGGVLLKRVRHERKIESLGERLLKEAWYSVQLALEVAALLPPTVRIEIHLDVNGDERHRSAHHLAAVTGLVAGQGFTYRIKPEAWCATCIADKVVKRHAR